MSEGTLKKRLAMFILNIGGDYLSSGMKKELGMVKRADDKRAALWQSYLRLGFPPYYHRISVGVNKSFHRLGTYEPVAVNCGAIGDEDAEGFAKFAALATTVAKLAGTLQAVVDEYNAGVSPADGDIA
jgi:hypothetical protein